MTKYISKNGFQIGPSVQNYFPKGSEVPEEIAKVYPSKVEVFEDTKTKKEDKKEVEKSEPKSTSVKIEENKSVKQAPVKK